MLERAGHHTLEAEDGLAAYNILRQLDGALDLLITDIVMPRMSGTELVERLAVEYPDLRVLCISAYGDPRSPAGHYFLAKPFASNVLITMVEEVLGVSLPKASSERRTEAPEDLHARLIAAEAKLEAAIQAYGKLAALGSELANPGDGQLALGQAASVKRTAFREYAEALQNWTASLTDKRAG